MWEWDCYATELTLLFLFDFGVSICNLFFFRENKSQKAPGPKPHGMLQAGAYGAPQLWPGLYPPYDPYAAGYPFASVALSS